MTNRVTVSFKETNIELIRQGKEPFPFESFTFDAIDDEHLKRSVDGFSQQVYEWVFRQLHEKKSNS